MKLTTTCYFYLFQIDRKKIMDKSTTILLNRLIYIDSQLSQTVADEAHKKAIKVLGKFNTSKRDLMISIREFKESFQNAITIGLSEIEIAMFYAKMRKSYNKLRDMADDLISMANEKKYKCSSNEDMMKVLELHLEECSRLLDRTHNNELYTGSSSDTNLDEPSNLFETLSFLPDIDDPKFSTLVDNNAEIDLSLDILFKNVKTFNNIQQTIGQEIEEQDYQIDELGKRADKFQTNVEKVNISTSRLIKDLSSTKNLCCNLVLLVLILGLISIVYWLVSSILIKN